MFASRPLRPELGSLIHETRGLQRRSSRKIGRATQKTVVIISSNSLNRKKRDCFDGLLMLRSGARSIAQQGKI
jgi:hypothetical protein